MVSQKNPSAALRVNFVVAEGRGGSPSRPLSGNPAGWPYHWICAPCMVGASGARPNMGVRPDAPTIEIIVPLFRELQGHYSKDVRLNDNP